MPEPSPTTSENSEGVTDALMEELNTFRREVQEQGEGSIDRELLELQTFLLRRSRVGQEKYGVGLQTHNGRDPCIDLAEELVDALQYAKQWQMEADSDEELVDANLYIKMLTALAAPVVSDLE